MTLIKYSKNFLIIALCFLSVSCSKHSTPSYLGYIEGEYNNIASNVSGTLIELYVTSGQYVQKGDLLFALDPQPETAIVQAAEAKVDQVRDIINIAKIDYDQQKNLYDHHTASKSILDKARIIYEAKQKQLRIAQAELAKSNWSLKQKKVYSIINGEVINIFFHLGETVAARESVVAILDPANIKVVFYIPENQLSDLHIGQKIIFTCDNCKEKTRAKIEYVSAEPEFTPPVAYSKEERFKLVYLVRAAMSKTIARDFHPGQPVQVFLYE